MALSPVGDLGIALKSDVDDFHKGMRTSKESVGLLSASIRSLSAGVRNLGIAMTAGSAVAGAAMFGLTQRAARVEEAFAEVDTISREVKNSQKEYGDVVSKLNTTMGLQGSRLDIIDALYQSLSAGVSEGTEAQNEFLTSAAKLALVGRTELQPTVDVLSTLMNTYGKDTGFAERASEAMFRTVQFGKVTLDELVPVLGRVSAQASELGIQIEETGAAMAVLTARGFQSRIAATGLRNIYRDMLNPSERLEELFVDMAAESSFFADSMGTQEDRVRGLANRYNEATNALAEYEAKLQSARSQVDDYSLRIQEARLLQKAIEQGRREDAEAVIETNDLIGKSYNELQQIIEDYQFKVDKARVQEENHQQTINSLESEIQDVKDTFRQEINAAGDLQEGIGNLIFENQNFVETLTEVNEKAKEMDINMSELFPRTRSLQAILSLTSDDGEALNEIFAIMNENFQASDQAISDLASEFEDLSEEDIKSAINGLEDLDSMQEDMANTSAARLRDAQSELAEAAGQLGRVFDDELISVLEDLTGIIETSVSKFNSLDDSVRKNIGRFSVLATTLGLALGPMLLIGGQISLIASSLGTGLIPFLGIAGTLFGTLAFAIKNAVEGGKDSEAMFGRMQELISNLIDFVVLLRDAFVQELLPGLMNAGEGLIAIFNGVFDSFENRGGEGESIIRSIFASIGNAFSALGDFLKNNSTTIVSVINSIITGFFGLVRFLLNKAIPSLVSFGNKLVQELKPAAIEVKDAISSVVQSIIEFANSQRASEILSTIQNEALELANTLSGLVQDIVKFVSENKQLILKVTAATLAFAGAAKAISGLAAVLGAIVGPLAALIPIASGLAADIAMWVKFFPGATVAVKALGASLLALASPIGIIAGVVVALLGIFAYAWVKDIGGARDIVDGLVEAVIWFGEELGRIIEPLMNFVGSIVDFVDELLMTISVWTKWIGKLISFGDESTAVVMAIGSMKAAISGAVDAIVGIIQVLSGVIDILSGVIALLRGDFDSAMQKFKDAWNNIASGTINIVKGMVKSVVGLFVGLPASIATALGTAIINVILWPFKKAAELLFGNSIVPEMISSVVSLFASFPRKIVDAIGNIVQKVVGVFQTISQNVIGVFQGIIDWWTGIGQSILEAIKVDVLVNKLTSIWKGDEGVIQKVINTFGAIVGWWSDIGQKISDAIPELSQVISVGQDIGNKLIEGMSNVIDGLGDLIPISMQDAVEWGESLVNAIAQGIAGAGDVIKDAIEDAAGVLARFLPSSPAEEGPLSKGEKPPQESGRRIVSGMATGIRKDSGRLQRAMDTALGLGTQAPSVSPSVSSGRLQNDGQSTVEIVVEEGAVENNIEGVKDEDVPDKVQRKTEESLNKVIEDMEKSGKRIATRK